MANTEDAFFDSSGSEGGDPGEQESMEVPTSATDAPTMYIPEPVLTLNSAKPPLPCYDAKELPPGIDVWVCDPEDVSLLLRANFSSSLLPFCAGQKQGKLVRHCGDVAYVQFNVKDCEGVDMVVGHTFPRACLDKERIEPYNINATDMSNVNLGFGVVGPTNTKGGGLKGSGEIHLSGTSNGLSVLKVHVDGLATAMQLIEAEKYPESIAELTKQLSLLPNLDKEIRCLRSQALMETGAVSESLTDALTIIDVNPSWVKGYLRAAVAYESLGNLQQTRNMLQQAMLLAPGNSEIQLLVSANRSAQLYEKFTADGLIPRSIAVVCGLLQLRKQVVARRPFRKGDAIGRDRAIASVATITSAGTHCGLCMRPLANLLTAKDLPPDVRNAIDKLPMTSPTPCQHGCGAVFCSAACRDIAWSEFHVIECRNKGVKTFEYSYNLIRDKAERSSDKESLNFAMLAMRLSAMALAKKMADPLVQLLCAPVLDVRLNRKQKQDIASLYLAVSGKFTDEMSRLMPETTFVSLFFGVVNYAAKATISPLHCALERHHSESLDNVPIALVTKSKVEFTFISRFASLFPKQDDGNVRFASSSIDNEVVVEALADIQPKCELKLCCA